MRWNQGASRGQLLPGMSDSDGSTHSRVWKRPSPIGETEALRGLGGIVAPVLMGFALATIAALAAGSTQLPGADAAIFLLVLSAGCFLYDMQFTSMALRYAASPAERLDWLPEATVDEGILEQERKRQARDRVLCKKYSRRAAFFYDIGLLTFLGSMGAVLVPSHWTLWRGLAALALGVAIAVELVWAVGRWTGHHWKRLTPLEADVPEDQVTLSPLEEANRQAVLRNRPHKDQPRLRPDLPRA